jgi:hypothetical protein
MASMKSFSAQRISEILADSDSNDGENIDSQSDDEISSSSS